MNRLILVFCLISRVFSFEIGKLKNNIPGVYTNCRKSGMIALSFDDGVMPETEEILDILARHDVPATFFVIANTIEWDPMQRKVLKRIINEGHTLGSHTYSHADLTYLDAARVEAELKQAAKVYKTATGMTPRFMRPPFGSVNAAVLAVTDRLGYKVVNWNLETNDWRLGYDSTPILEACKAGEYDGSRSSKIVLMHDRPVTVQGLNSVIKFYKKLDYRFVNMEKCLGSDGYF